MNATTHLTGQKYIDLIRGGASYLRHHVKTVNDLNVFPIPDGDTGDNMLLTMLGGAEISDTDDSISAASSHVAKGMLLGARGNSGVILSQFFDGIAQGFCGLNSASADDVCSAFLVGVEHAYSSVLRPTEGTILTVAKEATNFACNSGANDLESFMEAFIDEARRSLDRTPELLEVLKKAGVVDSGAAGLIYIMEGMLRTLRGENIAEEKFDYSKDNRSLDFSLFDENSKMSFGYCTELLVRLQTSKTDIENFDTANVTRFLENVGDSIVCVKTDSILKIHVHTLTPEKVLEYCRGFGEFLTVKIENMTLQHSNNDSPILSDNEQKKERTKYGVVAVASGDGIKNTFYELGADVVVDGGQSMNPSTDDFIKAFEKANADTIFVFPNNSNIILAAKQAANIFTDGKVYVVESKTIGHGYAALSMMNPDLESENEILCEFASAMEGVVTAEISKSVRDSIMQENVPVACGDYIGIVGKEILTSDKCRLDAVVNTIDRSKISEHDIVIVIRGIDSDAIETDAISQHVKKCNPFAEVYTIDGGQDVYSYIIVAE
ncbi:MAG: DAK2 domain-containing protein [Ruminococcaceae bacterium]|nr:DAK2 domain-containing protein [Oscillospiraceae bacterium]